MLQMLAEECQNVLNLKHDAAMIQHADHQYLNINSIRTTKPQFAKRVTQPTPNKTPPSPCKHCGAWHFHRDCPFRQNCCQLCKKIGHKDGFCQNTPSSSQQPKRSRIYRHKTKQTVKSLSLIAFLPIQCC